MNLKPLDDRIVVKPNEAEQTTASGLVIPDTAKEKQQKGLVIAVGDDEDLINVNVGEKVLFPKYTGTELTLDGKDYLVIDSSELLAVLNRGAA